MIKETFRHIDYSNEKRFYKNEQGKIELKQFTEDLVFAVNFDSTFNAIYCIGSKEPESIIGVPEIANFDAFNFGQHGELKGTVIYEEESFRAIENEGSIKFYLRAGFNNSVGEQHFKNINPVLPIPIVKDYGVTIYTNDIPTEFNISLEPTDNGLSVYNKLAVKLIGNGFQCYKDVNNKIKITTTGYGDEILVTDPLDPNMSSLITLMGGMSDPFIANGPTTNTEFLKLSTKYDNTNKISLTHKTDSHIQLNMYDYTGVLIVDQDLGLWSNNRNKYYAFELNWNEQLIQFFIGGKLNTVFMASVERKDCRTFLYLNGAVPNNYLIDELQVYNTTQHNKNYSLETSPLTPYDSENPYIDVNYGQGFIEKEIKDIIIDGTTGLHFTIKIGLTWYYYFNGSWRTGDGSFGQSTDLVTFEAKFAELFFNENFDLLIRIFFNSDGWTPVSIDEISIIREVGGVASAYITGEIRLSSTVDLSSDSYIKISTNLGFLEVDLTTAAIDTTAVTLEEIKQAIREANVPGLASISDDGNSRLVLIAADAGSSSYISVSEPSTSSALDLVWGSETSDIGEDTEFTGGVFVDYSEIFRWIRSRLGAPLVPVELTDEQLEDCLSESIYHYNKWRNFKENIAYANIQGNPISGWEIPIIIGGAENILEVIMEPKYPMSYYAGRDDLMSNIFIQHIFSSGNLLQTAADYHISLIAQKDLSLILNTEVRWEILNRRLFITPIPSDTLKVAIKYKSSLTLDEIVTSQAIRDLTLAISKITLGNIRSTFGNAIPGGDGMLQLNGSELKAEGQTDKEAIITGWQKSTGVYEFIIG